MKLETWQRDRNERCMERHQLSIERLQMIDQEETVQDRYRPYFRMCAAFLLKLESLRRTIEDHSFETFTLEERKRWNLEFFVYRIAQRDSVCIFEQTGLSDDLK